MNRYFTGFFRSETAPITFFAVIIFCPCENRHRLSARCAFVPPFMRLALLQKYKISPFLEPKSMKKADF